ncbi:MAG: hypothetical protein P8176_04970 [Gammaproteobacteria bacterium]
MNWPDDVRLQEALVARGHQVDIINWENVEPNLQRFDAIYVSSTWNSCHNPSAFINWLTDCEQDGKPRLINDRAVLDAGFVKYRYWRLLEQALHCNPALQMLGQLTPSRFYLDDPVKQEGVEPLDGGNLTDVLAQLDGDPQWARANVVLKPVVSADGIDTFLYNRLERAIPIDEEKRSQFVLENAKDADAAFMRLACNRERHGVLLQPYMDGVEAGEYSLTIIGNKCTHAIQKPKLFKGDGASRRQLIELDRLPGSMLSFAEKLVACLDSHFGAGSVSRARVDLFDQQGVPVLCEIECTDLNMNIQAVATQNARRADSIVQAYANVIEQRAAALRIKGGEH